MPDPILSVTDLKKHFPVRVGVLFKRTIGQVKAVDGVSFDLMPGETLGVVGESGCGKSTLAQVLMRLEEPTSGTATFEGRDIFAMRGNELRKLRREIQIVLQDPYTSLNPRMTVGDIVGEPLSTHGIASGRDKAERVAKLFDRVGLTRAQMQNYPHQFSGGQRQRIGIARALALNPKLIVCDEPVSALDVSIQAQVINLLMDLQRELKLSYLFISHNLAVVEHISHRIAVMYLGKIVEYADRATVFTKPGHPYTEALLAAIPVPDPKVRRKAKALQGDVPSPVNPPSGCAFHTRCPYVVDRCKAETPLLREISPRQFVACHLR